MIAYWAKAVAPQAASESPVFARIQMAGPWLYAAHPEGGTLAYLNHWPEQGQTGPRSPDGYGEARDCGDGLIYLPPKKKTDIWDLGRENRAGVDFKLACGKTVSIPVALVQHRQFRVGPGAKDRLGEPISEYGALAIELLKSAQKDGKLDEEDPRLWRLIALAFSQCYRLTPELLDDTQCFALDDIDPLLGLVWWGDPKALSPAPPVAAQDSESSASTKPISAQAT